MVHTLLRPPSPPVLTRLRLLMTSVLREMGRGRPCSFKKRPQALQRTAPVSSRRHKGVVLVEQFWQTGWERSAYEQWKLQHHGCVVAID